MKIVDENKNSNEIHKLIFKEGIGLDEKTGKIYNKYGDCKYDFFSIFFFKNNDIPQLWIDFYVKKSSKDKRIPFLHINKLNSLNQIKIYIDLKKHNKDKSQHINAKIIFKKNQNQNNSNNIDFKKIKETLNHISLKWTKENNFNLVPYFNMFKHILLKLDEEKIFKNYYKYRIINLPSNSINYKELNKILYNIFHNSYK